MAGMGFGAGSKWLPGDRFRRRGDLNSEGELQLFRQQYSGVRIFGIRDTSELTIPDW